MSIRRVAMVFDDETRPETTGGYCLRALRQLVSVEHFRPSHLDRIPRDGFDLYLRIDDGLDYQLAPALRPSAWWVIDTHLNFERDRERAADFDLVFAAQRDGAEGLRREGVASASWLPLACDPEIHACHQIPKIHDLCFVGNVPPGPRAELLGLLQRHYRGMFIGNRYFEEMARTYSASRLVFNRSIRNDINMRVFEALACGSLLVTNDLSENGQAELFRDGTHLATYHTAEELLDKVRFYLTRESARERVAVAGRAEAVAKHTYRQRMEQLLAAAEKRIPSITVASTDVPRLPEAEADSHTAPPPTVANRGTPLGPDRSYFEFARPELLARVPPSARRILEIGCGAGRLGEAIKARQTAEVVGVEFDPLAAEAARRRLDRVLCSDVERLETDFPAGSFDVVVCGDVLEHLRDPATLLRKVHSWLAPDGRLVASIPNVRHHTVIRGLLEGNWTYETAGLLDRTHLHFFTRRSIEELLARCDFAVESVAVVFGPGDEEMARAARMGVVHAGRFRLEGLSAPEAEEFFTYQYLVNATRSRSSRLSTLAPVRAEATSNNTPPKVPLGCVLAIRDRAAATLERTFQTYAFQIVAPLDKVLLDYGSPLLVASEYRSLCEAYGWRYVRAEPSEPGWNLSDAYNQAVAALHPEVEVVFKSDVDVLLGEDVLATAADRGREHLCFFARLTSAADAVYPARFDTPRDMVGLLERHPAPVPEDSEGIQAFPRRWFDEIGGFDRAYRGWGYEDSDLRLRAEWSIGVVRVTKSLLIHQGHPRGAPDPRTARNRVYYESTKATRVVVRNKSIRSTPTEKVPASARAGLRLPRILHQIWVGPKPIPAAAVAYTESWKRHHPAWEMRLWTDSNLPPLQNARLYKGTTLLAQKADLLRYEVLLQFGGLYVDIDFECLRSLEPLLDGVEYIYGDQRPGEPNIALLGCTPAHPFARHCVERLPERWPWRRGQILEETGPAFFRRAILDYLGSHRLQPLIDPRSARVAGHRLDSVKNPPLWALHPWVVYPYFLGETWRPAHHPDAYAVHHWQKNWE